jgi:hypothetical protein
LEASGDRSRPAVTALGTGASASYYHHFQDLTYRPCINKPLPRPLTIIICL